MEMKFLTGVKNISMEGTLSQIFDIGLSFWFQDFLLSMKRDMHVQKMFEKNHFFQFAAWPYYTPLDYFHYI